MSKAPSPWRIAKGPMGATIALLLYLNWRPISPDAWLEPSPSSDIWQFHDGNTSHLDFHRRLEHYTKAKILALQSCHLSESGFDSGIDLSVLKRHIKYLIAQGLPGHATALRKIAVGSWWTTTRQATAGYPVVVACPFCGHDNDTVFHRVYECRSEILAADDIISSTQWVLTKSPMPNHCRWLRGILPSSWSTPSSAPNSSTDYFAIGRPSFGPGLYGSDGSGGTSSSDSRRRRCGGVYPTLFSIQITSLFVKVVIMATCQVSNKAYPKRSCTHSYSCLSMGSGTLH